MKAQISRESHRPENRFSGVYHDQGAMVTDADLDERSTITRMRTEALGNDAIRDGVPEKGGIIGAIDSATPFLRPGVIYADGVRGELAVLKNSSGLDFPLTLFNRQADLPWGPRLPDAEMVLYADLWERPVYPLEEPYLADAGLHGAVTGFRTRTMTQLKVAPIGSEDEIEAGKDRFPTIGTAKLEIGEIDPEFRADDCDPCAEVVEVTQEIGNALWRLEVIAVEGPANAPTRIALAWSSENAGVIAPADISPEAFERAGKVYEFFSQITESHTGVFADSSDMRLPAFVGDLEETPSPDKDHDGSAWPFVRRWDGYAEIDLPGGVTRSLGDDATLTLSVQRLSLELPWFTATLDLDDAAVMRGDYWLVEMRGYAPEGERIRLVQDTPFGIEHHYCVIGRAKDGEFLPFSDAQRRKLSLPPLSDLPADHIGYANHCTKLFGGAENVQDALDNLCSISAEDIGFTSNCRVLYDDAETVQEALDALCNIDLSGRESFRYLFDWGVLCGLVPRWLKTTEDHIAITPGAYLDRAGRFTRFEGGEFDLNALRFGREILFETEQAFAVALRKGEACIALAAGDGGATKLFIVDKSLAYGPADPGFGETVRRCVSKKKRVPVTEIVANGPEIRKRTANKIFLTATGKGAFTGTARLTKAEFRASETLEADLVDAFREVPEDDEIAVLKERIAAAKMKTPLDNATGAALEVRQMQRASAVFAAFAQTDEERLRRCVCAAMFPHCPPELGDGPYFVPIGCVKGNFDRPRFNLTQVCAQCCRKQALTPRTMHYFLGGMLDNLGRWAKKTCCVEEEANAPVKPASNYDPGKYEAFETGKFIEENKLRDAFLGLPEKLPSDFTTEVAVNELSLKEATQTLRGTGIEVALSVDINDAAALDQIEANLKGLTPDELLGNGAKLRPGDKVALLVQNGTARGYVLVERGTGKLPFDPVRLAEKAPSDKLVTRDTETPTPPDGLAGVLDKLTARQEALLGDLATARGRIEALETLRDAGTGIGTGAERAALDALRGEIGTARTELGALNDAREALAAQVKTATEELAAHADSRAKLTRELRELSAEVGALTDARDGLRAELPRLKAEFTNSQRQIVAMRQAMRAEMPLNAVLGNEESGRIAALVGEGVLTVGDLARLDDAQVKTLARKFRVTIQVLKKSKTDATRFLNG